MNETRELLAHRLQAVEERIAAACRRANRARDEVTLVAVTKTVSAEIARELHGLGVANLGENRPQELWAKAVALPQTVRWHMVGHLQRNKVERTLPLVQLIHGVDSLRLLTALEDEATRQERNLDVLLEVNASREASKQGFAADAVLTLPAQLPPLQRVRIRGLMTMAAPEEDPERTRPTFAELRRLRDQLRPLLPAPHECLELSMGMSNDFAIAIEEGATLIRLGTVLFEGLGK